MNTQERIKEIKDHFANLTLEQFEANLEKAGIGTIKPSGHDFVLEIEEEYSNCKAKLNKEDELDYFSISSSLYSLAA